MLHVPENSVWLTPGLTQRLVELHGCTEAAALSMSMLADKLNEEFGTSLTRNSIVGRCRRLGLDARLAPTARRTPSIVHRIVPVAIRIDAPIVPLEALPPEQPSDGLTIYQIGNSECHWPLGETFARPPFLYCGDIALEGRPYCGAHCAKAYNAPAKVWA